MSKHTPGPWKAVRLPRGDHKIDCKRWKELATVYGNEDRQLNAEGAANARLIAAAPELLEHLQHYVAQHGCACGHPACRRCHESEDAKAAIAKATGGGT